MKLITNLSIFAAALVALGSTTAFADDSQLQNRLAVQNAQNAPRTSTSSTVALYSSRNGVSGAAAQDEQSNVRFELRSNSHGQLTGSYESAR